MQIREITVKSLFGIFDHIVRMNLDDRITIIHGPNGFGKTTILRLIDSFFSGRYSEIRKIPFDSLLICFDGHRSLRIIRREPPKGKGREVLDISLTQAGETLESVALPGITPETLGLPLNYIESSLPFLRRIGDLSWRDTRTREELNFEEVVRSYGQYFPSGLMQRVSADPEPEWLQSLRKSIKVRLIESQRLLRVGKLPQPHTPPEEEPVRPYVVIYAKELARHIQAKLAEYGALSQSLDRSFPRRLVEQRGKGNGHLLSVEELQTKLQQLEIKRNQLTDAGLLDKEEEEFNLSHHQLDEILTSSVLPVYVRDADEKLQIFDDILKKIELFKGIINARFLYKKMLINKDKGFTFTTSRSKALAPTYLSSGEQHMVVLLYELLFKVEPNSLILIDEPEISLHVAWQLEFLRDLRQITELASIDVLMATHAAGIINDRWDLTVELKAPLETE